MKKNGFTLIELLAVVIVLGIIASIAVPSVNKLISNGKKSALFTTANNLVDTAKQYYMNEILMNDELASSVTLSVTDNANMSLLEYSGKLPSSGYIIVDTTGNIGIAVMQGDYCAKKEIWDNEVVVSINTNCEITDLEELEEINNSCFILNDEKDTIIDYKINNSNCSRDVVIPAEIAGNKIIAIGTGAFAGKGKLVGEFIKDGESYYDIVENSSFYGSEPSVTVLINPDNYTTKECYYGYDWDYDDLPLDYRLTSNSKYFGCYINNVWNGIIDSYNIESVNFNIAVNLESIGAAAFLNNKITSLIFTDNNINLKNIDYSAFSNNYINGDLDLSSLMNLTRIGSSAFSENLITSVIFPEGLKTIETNAFSYNHIDSVILSSTITTINDGAFALNGIETINLSSATSLTYIGDYVFVHNLLITAELPDSIITIANHAFVGNDDLIEIYLNREYGDVDGSPWGANNANVVWALTDKYSVVYVGSDATLSDSCINDGKYYQNCNVRLVSTVSNKEVISFKTNGITVIGNTFEMPGHDITITDVIFADVLILESVHPYLNNMDETYTITVPNATKLMVTFSSDTYVERDFDYIYITNASGTQIGSTSYTDTTLANQSFTIDGDTLNVRLTSDGSSVEYGFLVTIVKLE